MANTDFESRVKARGMEIFKQVEKEKPSLFKKYFWTGKVMDWAMKDEAFKVQMFRFVDVFPYLNSPEAVAEHIQQYFCRPEHDFPKALQFGLKRISPNSMAAKMAARGLSSNINAMGKQFIVGNTLQEAAPVMKKIRDKGVGWVMKILKEEVKSVQEEEDFVRDQIRFFEEFEQIGKSWPALGKKGTGDLDWGDAPKCVMSVMVSSLYAQYMDKACAFDHSVERAKERLRPILRKAREIGACLILDMEHLPLRELTLATYQSIMEEAEFAGYPHTGIVYQAYLRDAETPLEDLLQWARKQRQPMHIRLVKGAFWDEEVVRANQNNLPIPVFTNKYETDAMFERLTRRILENHDLVTFKCASHNIRSIAFAQETANDLGVPREKFEIQMLYGMAENLRTALVRSGYRLRLYAPIGEVIPGMAYLVRRLLENTSNESFLRQSFKEGMDKQRLLTNPAELAKAHAEAPLPPVEEAPAYGDKGSFLNEPPFAWTVKSRQDMVLALEEANKSSPRSLSLHINGQELSVSETFLSLNPNDPDQILAHAASAGSKEVDQALAAARTAFREWSKTGPRQRSEVLFRAAEAFRRQRHALVAMNVLEIGKNWNEAQADVNEAIDFLEYYGREMIRLSRARSVSGKLGENSRLIHEPRGVAAVIPPYNMALPISIGTIAAPLVTGNSVVYKSPPQAPVLGSMLTRILQESGLPRGVLNHVCGPDDELGENLVSHPEVDLVVFTGGETAGQRVLEAAAKTGLSGRGHKKTILSLVGKNAIIMDSDADLDAAVSGVVDSAFGYQGQKCSACSRLIVLEDNYDKVLAKVRDAADSLDMGPVEDPRYSFGAIIDHEARKRVEEAVRTGKEEAKLLLEKRPEQSTGYTVPLAIFAGVKPEHRLAREQAFGPVLSIIRVKDFDQALEVANSLPYALTGGVYSRNPAHIEKAYQEFKVGNLYINQGITGALVGRHPFGGFFRSGDGSKTGGPDYLKEFMVTRTITENTFRSGFAP